MVVIGLNGSKMTAYGQAPKSKDDSQNEKQKSS